MIVQVEVEPSVARIYQAEAEEHGTTMLELMAAVLAFWPAAQWKRQAQPPVPERVDPPFGAGF